MSFVNIASRSLLCFVSMRPNSDLRRERSSKNNVPHVLGVAVLARNLIVRDRITVRSSIRKEVVDAILEVSCRKDLGGKEGDVIALGAWVGGTLLEVRHDKKLESKTLEVRSCGGVDRAGMEHTSNRLVNLVPLTVAGHNLVQER